MDNNITKKNEMDALEKVMLGLPQVECRTAHYFGPGVYIREVTMPAGACVIGHEHKQESLNMMIKGKLILIDHDNGNTELEAPYSFVGSSGRKLAYIVEDTVWQNVFPNHDNCTDVDLLEDRFITKTAAAIEFTKAKLSEVFP